MTVSHREKNILEFDNEKQILSEAYSIYRKLKREGNW